MKYRVCKAFEVETGHMLSKHPGRCRFPHGHSRRVEIVLSSDRLDDNDMVCDFAAIKAAVRGLLDELDHAMAVNSNDPVRERLGAAGERVVVFQDRDPTTEVLAKHIFDHVAGLIASGAAVTGQDGRKHTLPRT